MKVYVVETGCYENCYIAGIYTSPEAAMLAHPIAIEGGWRCDATRESWYNGLDWDDAASINAIDLQGEMWRPASFGGSTAIASQLGLMAVFAARAGYDDTAAMFARWAWREAVQYFDVMDKKQHDGEPFELYYLGERDR